MTAGYPEIASIYLADKLGDGIPVAQTGARIEAEVISEFSSGFYLRDEQRRIFAVGGPQIPAGPIHLVLKHQPPRPSVGTRAGICSHLLDIGPIAISLRSATRYCPYRPTNTDLIRITPQLAKLYRLDDVLDDMEPILPSLTTILEAGELDSARSLLQGRGGGLTPTGDDVLAGVLLYHAWAGTTPETLRTIAMKARTNDLSRAFLKWAAEGQSIQPIHDLVHAGMRLALEPCPDRSSEIQVKFKRAASRLRGIGHSSGLALLMGLGLAARLS